MVVRKAYDDNGYGQLYYVWFIVLCLINFILVFFFSCSSSFFSVSLLGCERFDVRCDTVHATRQIACSLKANSNEAAMLWSMKQLFICKHTYTHTQSENINKPRVDLMMLLLMLVLLLLVVVCKREYLFLFNTTHLRRFIYCPFLFVARLC